jgi:hypothetical protein
MKTTGTDKSVETERQGFFKRRLNGLKSMVGWSQVQANAEWIAEGAAVLDPRRFPLSEREKWMNPAKNDFTFDAVMYRNGVDEAELSKRHRALAFSTYASLLGFGAAAGLTMASPSLGQILAAIGVCSMLLVLSARHSYQSMQIRDRNLNLHMRQWLARKWEWIPPLDNN